MKTETTKDLYRQTFSERLKRYRGQLYKQPADFAIAAGLNVDAYKKYESRASLPPHHQLVDIAAALGIDVFELLTGDPPATPRPLPEEAHHLAIRWMALPEAMQRQVENYMTMFEVLIKTCPVLGSPKVAKKLRQEMEYYKILQEDGAKRRAEGVKRRREKEGDEAA